MLNYCVCPAKPAVDRSPSHTPFFLRARGSLTLASQSTRYSVHFGRSVFRPLNPPCPSYGPVYVFRALLPTAPGFRNSSRMGPVALEPPKQPTEVSTLIQTLGLKKVHNTVRSLPLAKKDFIHLLRCHRVASYSVIALICW